MRSPCLGGDVPEDRSDVPVAVEQYPEDDERQSEARAPHRRARAERGREREDRGRDHQPADQVVQECRACEEPAVLLVDQDGGPGDEEGERHRQAPVAALQLAADEAELRASGQEPWATMWIVELV